MRRLIVPQAFVPGAAELDKSEGLARAPIDHVCLP
jgi:hypothetical protein